MSSTRQGQHRPPNGRSENDARDKTGAASRPRGDAGAQPLLSTSPLGDSRSADTAGTGGTASGSSGLPQPLRNNLESLSGFDLSSVQVHTNSSKATALGADAFAQSQHIHLAPGGQEALPHEAWHVVQQMQGRVSADSSRGGMSVSSDPTLEQEADRMGGRASSDSYAAAVPSTVPASGVGYSGVAQFTYPAIARVEVNVNAGEIVFTLTNGSVHTYKLSLPDSELPTPMRKSGRAYRSGTPVKMKHVKGVADDQVVTKTYNFRFSYRVDKGQANPDDFATGNYSLFVYLRGASGTGDGAEGEPGNRVGEPGTGGAIDEGKKPGGGGTPVDTAEVEKLAKRLGGSAQEDVDSTPLTDEERRRAADALSQLSASEQKRFLRTMEAVAAKCAGDSKCGGKGLADMLEYYAKLDESSREALSINQMLKADMASDSDELPDEVLLNIETDAKATADATGKAQEINQNLALIQSKIVDSTIEKDFDQLDLDKLSELNTLIMIEGMLAGASERLPEMQPVVIELTANVGKLRDFILEEIAWLSAEIAATALFSFLTAPVTGGASLAAGTAAAGHLALRLNKLRLLIRKIQKLVAVIEQIQSIIATFQTVRDSLEKADHLLDEFQHKREQVRRIQELLRKGEASLEQIQSMEDLEDELLALMLGTEGKDGEPARVGMIEKLRPVLDQFFLPDELSEEELKGLIFDIPDGIEAMEEMLAYKQAVEGGNADQTVTLSLKGFRAGYLLAPFVGFLTGVINDKLNEIMADKTIAERLLGFGGRKRAGAKFKGSRTRPAKRLKKVKSHKQKREEAEQTAAGSPAKRKDRRKEKDPLREQEQPRTAAMDDSGAKWSRMQAEIHAIGRQAREQGGMTKSEVHKKVAAITGMAAYREFNAKVKIESYARDPALNRVRVEDRRSRRSAAAGAGQRKPRRKSDILVLYLRPKTERHKSLNAAIRKTFKDWPGEKSDTKEAIAAELQELKRLHGYPAHLKYSDVKEQGDAKVEPRRVDGDIIAWDIKTGLLKNKLAEIISIPRPGNYWGSYNNPIEIPWQKPAITNSSAYRPLYIGPYVAGEARVTQAELEAHRSKSKSERQMLADDIETRVTKPETKTKVRDWKQDPEIKKYTAIGGPTKLPGPSRSSIGVIPEWQVKAGGKFPFVPRERSHERGATFTNKIRLFGYYAQKEGKDGDHVWEIQVGGPDKVENMWTLDAGLNQEGGRKLEQLDVRTPEGRLIKMRKLKQQAKKNVAQGKEMWIKVKSTK